MRRPAPGHVVGGGPHDRRNSGGVRTDGGRPDIGGHPADRPPPAVTDVGRLNDCPVGGILGAVVFYVVLNRTTHSAVHPVTELLLSVGIGVAGAAVGIVALWFCLRKLHLDDLLGTTCQLAIVVSVAAVCDTIRDDSGLIAAVLMGLAVANARVFEMPASRRQPFFETLVNLIIGSLFVTISATVTPESVRPLILPTLGLVAVLVVLARPLVASIATFRTGLTRGERASSAGWHRAESSPRLPRQPSGPRWLPITSARSKILPVTFLVIVATVALYGLTARPVAHRLGVTRPARTRPLLVGGDPRVIDLARASARPAWTCSCGPRPNRSARRSEPLPSSSRRANSSHPRPARAPKWRAST